MKCFKNEITIPTRFKVGAMICLACIIFAIIRSNMSIIILAMTENPYDSSIVLPDYGVRYPWTTYEQSLVIGSYFWGNTLICSIAGIFAERYGARYLLGCAFCIAALLSSVSPVAAQFLWLAILLRFLTGVVMGTVYPSLHALIANWVPSDERGKFLSLLTTSGIGAVIDWSMSGHIIEQFGWTYAFYVVAVIFGIFAVMWMYLIYDSPNKHPSITDEEKEFITSKLSRSRTDVEKKVSKNHRVIVERLHGGAVEQRKPQKQMEKQTCLNNDSATTSPLDYNYMPWPPFRSIFRSTPFWALLCFHFGDMCGYYFLLTSVPKYLSEVHSFSITATGLFASVPYLTRVPCAIMFGYVGDLLVKRKTISTNAIRKIFSICSHFIPGCFLICITFVGDQPYTCLTFITIGLCFNSAVVVTSMHNAHDLAPNFASSIYGLISLVASSAGYLAPLLVAYFTRERSTNEEWRMVFYVGAGMYIGTAIIFIIFGSGYTQKWNNTQNCETPDDNKPAKNVKKTSNV